MQSVVLFQNTVSKYGVLGQMIRDMQKAFVRRGIRAVIRELNPDPEEIKKVVEHEAPDCTWSINTYLDEHVVFSHLGIPQVDLSVDSVIHSCPDALVAPHIVSLFVDKASCDLFSEYSDNPVCWFPHAIAKEVIEQVRNAEVAPLENRPYDVTLIGSFIDHEREKRLWNSLFDPGIVDTFVSLAERGLADHSFPFVEQALLYIKETVQVQEVLQSVGLTSRVFLHSVERYARGLDRERLLKALSSRTIHIFTDPEDAKQWSSREAARTCHFEPAVPFSEVVNVCRNSKVVINSAPHIQRGYHERLFLSLASGAVTLVGTGHLLPSWLVETGRVVKYDSSSLDGLAEKIRAAEERPFDAEKILSWLEREHTWDARLDQHLPEIERSVKKLHAEWKENPLWRIEE